MQMNNIEVLYTSYCSRFDVYIRYRIMMVVCLVILSFLLIAYMYDKIQPSKSKLFIFSIVLCMGMFCYSVLQDHIPTHYVDYEYVLINEKTIDKYFLSEWKIREMKGEIYVIEPVKKGSVQNEHVPE